VIRSSRSGCESGRGATIRSTLRDSRQAISQNTSPTNTQSKIAQTIKAFVLDVNLGEMGNPRSVRSASSAAIVWRIARRRAK